MKNSCSASPFPRWLVRWSLLGFLCASMIGACANRGMLASTTDTDGSAGGGGTVTDTGGSGSGGVGTGGAASGGAIGSGGTIGTGGNASGGAIGTGGAAVDSGPDVAATDARDTAESRDASDANADRACSATTFPFEVESANVLIGVQGDAAKSIANSTANPYCGQRSLEISTAFSGTMGSTTVAEVLITLTGTQQNLAGKTITIHVSAIPEPTPTTYLALILNTTTGFVNLVPSIKPLTTDWITQSYKLPSGADGGVITASKISIQIFDINGYSGKIYVDGLDIR